MAPNTAISMVANRLRLKFMVPTEMPSWWRATTFCRATAVSEGSGPKPAPTRINVSSNDSGVISLDRPMQMVRDQAAEQRSAAAGRGVGRCEVAVIAAAFLGRDQVGEHDHAHGRQATAAQPVQDATE